MSSENNEFECADCGMSVPADAEVCPNCGASFYDDYSEFEQISISSDPFEIAAFQSLLEANNIVYSVHEDSLNTIYGHSVIRPAMLLVKKDQADRARKLIEEYRKDIPHNEDSADQQDVQIEGVRGWLLSLCVVLTIINPVSFTWYVTYYLKVHPVFPYRYPLMNSAYDTHIILMGVIFLYGVVTGIRLWSTDPEAGVSALRYFNIFFIYALVSFLFISFLFIIEGVSLNSSTELIAGDILRNTIGSVSFALIWKYYIKHSERVKNTYSRGL